MRSVQALIHGPPQQRMMLAILIASDLRTFLGMAQMQKGSGPQMSKWHGFGG